MPKIGIFGKIFGLVLIISISIVSVTSLILVKKHIQSLEEALIQETEVLLGSLVTTIETEARMNILPLKILKKIADEERVIFLWMVRPDGKIYYADSVEMWGKEINDPFLKTKRVIHRDAFDPVTGKRVKIFAAPLIMEPLAEPWTFFLGISTHQVEIAQRTAIINTFILLLLFILLSTISSFYLTKRITKSLEELRKGAEIVGKGNFDYRIKIKTGDEIEELANTFNKMAEDLKESQAALEEAKTVLEIKVRARTRELQELTERQEEIIKERTKEIQERMKELERFHKLAVGRELKMVELKKEIKRLKEELEKSRS